MPTPYIQSNGFKQYRALKMLVSAAAGVLLPVAISAADTTATWTDAASGGNWSNGANWSTSPTVPSNGNGGANYQVVFPNPPTFEVVLLDADITVDSVTINSSSIRLRQEAGTFNGGTINLGGGEYEFVGGTLSNTTVNVASGTFAADIGTLDNVHISGGNFSDDGDSLKVINGLTVDNHTIDLSGAVDFVQIDQTGNTLNLAGGSQASLDGPSHTIDHVTINGTGGFVKVGGPTEGGSPTLTLGTNTNVSGYGAFFDGTSNNTLINNGLINANVSGQTMQISNTAFTNNATAKAINGGTLDIEASSWTNASGGTISANASTLVLNGIWSNQGTISATNTAFVYLGGSFAPSDIGSFTASANSSVAITGALNNTSSTFSPASYGGTWQLSGGTITNGTLNLAGSNFFVSSGTLDGVHVAGGDLNVENGALTVKDGLSVDSHNINVSGVGSALIFYGSVPFPLNVTLGDDSSLTFDGPSQSVSSLTINATPSSAAHTPMIHISGAYAGGGIIVEPENTTAISGSMTFDDGMYPSTLNNNGTINANRSDQKLSINTTTFKNFANLKATNGGIVAIGPNTTYTEDGTLNTTGGGFQNDGATAISSAANTAAITGAGTLNLVPGSSLTIAANSLTSTQGGLTIDSALLDIKNNSLTLNYGSGGSPDATIRSYISNAYHGASLWTGASGITSTTAAADPAHHSVAYADGADGVVMHLPAGTSSVIPGGGMLPAGSEIVTYAFAADANLDGKVDFMDFIILSNHFGTSDPNWDHGNFNFDPNVDFADFIVLSNNFGDGGGTFFGASPGELAQYNAMARSIGISQSQIAAWDAKIANLPEPSGFIAGGVGLLLLISRRRRQRLPGALPG